MDDTHISWRRWQSFRVYLRFCLLNLALVLFAACCSMNSPPRGVGPLSVWQVWQWVFAFPFMAAEHLGVPMREWWWAFALVNPFLYGGIWWFAWRMWTLFRRKAE